MSVVTEIHFVNKEANFCHINNFLKVTASIDKSNSEFMLKVFLLRYFPVPIYSLSDREKGANFIKRLQLFDGEVILKKQHGDPFAIEKGKEEVKSAEDLHRKDRSETQRLVK